MHDVDQYSITNSVFETYEDVDTSVQYSGFAYIFLIRMYNICFRTDKNFWTYSVKEHKLLGLFFQE